MQFSFLMRYGQREDIFHLSLFWTLLVSVRASIYETKISRKFSTAVPDAWPRYRHCGMDFLEMIFKSVLGTQEILSWDFSAHKFMDVLWKFAVHLYCREKTALLWNVTVLFDTSLQPHLLPMPQKFIVFFGSMKCTESLKVQCMIL